MPVSAGSGFLNNSDQHVQIAVIGGGVYGLMIATTAAEAGMRVAILEQNRIGGATSSHWFRILHGGLRYLQSLDLKRKRESTRERRWFLQNFPSLVRPMGFVMPLYGEKARHPLAFRAALALDAALTMDRNQGLQGASKINRGRVLSTQDVIEMVPGVRTSGLLGGALWSDAVAADGHALLSALRARAEAAGCEIYEGARVTALETERGFVHAVRFMSADGREKKLGARFVVNAAGPWSAALAAALDRPHPELFYPSLAFNLVLDVPPPAAVGVALSPPDRPDQTLFLYPLKQGTFAGTWHSTWDAGSEDGIVPPAHEIEAFLDALNRSHPILNAKRSHIQKVHAGLLPVRTRGSTDLAVRETILDHGKNGGPIGLYSVSGVKFTTARLVAEKVIDQILASQRVPELSKTR